MPRAVKDRAFWMGALGCLMCFGLLQLVSNLPWAMGQSAVATSETSLKAGGRSDAPRLIPFQAYLTDAAGRPLEGQHTLDFELYEDPTQGSPLWTETHSSVPVTKGLVNVILGGTTPFGSLTFDAPRYVGISVDGGVEMVPRQQIIPTIYAADSDRAKQLVIPGTFTPAVTVATNGNVGIGTATPDSYTRLLVRNAEGPALVATESSMAARSQVIVKQEDQGQTNQWEVGLGGGAWYGAPGNFGIEDANGGTRMVIDTSGNVGIGTVSPTNRLSVAGSADFSGNVGIGTTGPESKLHVENDGITVRKTFDNVPATDWAIIETQSHSVAGLYMVVVESSVDWGRRHMYLVMFMGSNAGRVQTVLGSVYVGNPLISAEFSTGLVGGNLQLLVRPSETADVHVSKIRTLYGFF